MVPLVAGLGGGGLVAFFALRSMMRTRAWAFRLPPTWALGGGFVLALAAGLGLWQADISRAFLVPIFVALAALLAPLAAVAWAMGRQPGGVNARRGWVSFGLGATASTSLAYVLNTLLPTAVLFLVFGLADELLPLGEDLLEALQFGPLSRGAAVALVPGGPGRDRRHRPAGRGAGQAAGAAAAAAAGGLAPATRCCWGCWPGPALPPWRICSTRPFPGLGRGAGCWRRGRWARRCIPLARG